MSEKKRNLKRRGEPVKDVEKLSAARGADRGRGGGGGGMKEIRRNSAEFKFNMKRLRFLSDAQRVRQGCGAVMYWMVRDQRVQGNHL